MTVKHQQTATQMNPLSHRVMAHYSDDCRLQTVAVGDEGTEMYNIFKSALTVLPGWQQIQVRWGCTSSPRFTVTAGEKARRTFSAPSWTSFPSRSSNKRLSACEPSDAHVYDALICDQRLTLEPWSHVLHLHLLQVTLPGVLDHPGGGLSAAGLPQAGAASCGVNARVCAAAAVLTAVSATWDMKERVPSVSYTDKIILKFLLNAVGNISLPAVRLRAWCGWWQGLGGRVVDLQDRFWTDDHLVTQQLWLWVRGEEARNVGARRITEVLEEEERDRVIRLPTIKGELWIWSVLRLRTVLKIGGSWLEGQKVDLMVL